jgi:hypothetical protein
VVSTVSGNRKTHLAAKAFFLNSGIYSALVALMLELKYIVETEVNTKG